MRQEHPKSFYMTWHLVWGMLIAYFMAFIALHGYSMNPYLGLNSFEQVWRTISYVIPKWHIIIIPVGFIIVLLSGSIYGLMRKLQGEQRKTSIAVYFVLVLLGIGFFATIFLHYSLFIFVPLVLECLILSKIVGAPRKHAEKRKVEDLILN